MFSRSSNNKTPLAFSGFHCVGFVKSAHGLKGEIYIQLFAKQADWLDQLEALHLLTPQAQALQAFAIETLHPFKEGLRVRLQGCADRNASEALRKSQVYIADSLLVSAPEERIFLKEILGFAVCNVAGRELGVITDFSTNGVQDLLVVRTARDPEALVPFVDDFIVKVDFEARQVHMDLPEGLLEGEGDQA